MYISRTSAFKSLYRTRQSLRQCSHDCHIKQRLFPLTALTDRCLKRTRSAFCKTHFQFCTPAAVPTNNRHQSAKNGHTHDLSLCLITNSVHYCCDSDVSIASICTLSSHREVKGYDTKNSWLTAGVHKFSKTYKPLQNSRRQKGEVKQFPYWGPTNVRCHNTKFSRHCDLETGICAPLVYTVMRRITAFRSTVDRI